MTSREHTAAGIKYQTAGVVVAVCMVFSGCIWSKPIKETVLHEEKQCSGNWPIYF